MQHIRCDPRRPYRFAISLFCLLCVACDGGSDNSDSAPQPPAQPAAEHVLAFQQGVIEGLPPTLNILDRQGGSVQVSEDTEGKSVSWLVSPDARNAAYWYRLGAEGFVLVLVELGSATRAQVRLVIDGSIPAVEEWLQWLPDSRRVLYSTGGRVAEPAALWLASLDGGQPVKLFAAEPGEATLSYSAAADGSRVAVVANHAETVNGSYHLLSASLFTVEPGASVEPRLIDSVAMDETSLLAAWSPTGNQLLFYPGQLDVSQAGAAGPLQLVWEDGSVHTLREELTLKGSRWLDSSRMLVPLDSGFEVLGTDGNQLAFHNSAFAGSGGETGAASIIVSPDGRWLAFLDWTSETDLGTFLLDLDTAGERLVGPASSLPQAHHNVVARYDESELHWSRDSRWLAWDRRTLSPSQEYVYAHTVATAETREVSRRAKFSGEEGYPWLPEGNVLEYRLRVTGGDLAQYILVAEDLDADRTLFTEPYPFEAMTLTDPQSGQPVTITPYQMCRHIWLSNTTVLWNSCDENSFLSRLVDGSLGETELLTRSAVPLLVSNNREIVLLGPIYPEAHWLLYDHPAQRLIELQETSESISSWRYTFLL